MAKVGQALRPLSIAGFLVLSLLLSWTWAAETAPLRVGLDSNYPPFSRLDRRGHGAGFNLEVAEELCRAMGRRCEFEFQPLDRLLETMRHGGLDLLMGVCSTQDRLTYMDFSQPYFRSRSVYIGRAGNGSDGPKGMVRIGARGGSVQLAHALSRRGDRAVVAPDEFGRLLDMLCAGELDLILANDLAAYSFLLSERGQDFDVLGDPLPLDSLPGLVRIGVRKDEDELRQAVDRAIRDIRFSGAFGRINRSYFPYSLY
ncbi:transporter substrate-binding domain-containing protein [Desulfovibrio sp. PG-178-WT-4]|uniref:Transporter substrate-binding domain-containing protein n=1 Tax=Desulfovibrio porci TaxID=2605782 RepID=A0A6L5XJ34_9BACT|nr:transporter substrate-binding domain-containing protein [Desulfovibrio porci]